MNVLTSTTHNIIIMNCKEIDALIVPTDVTPSDYKLGDKIVRNVEITLVVPIPLLFHGIQHVPIIDKVTFIFINYEKNYELEGKLINNVWRISEYLIPMQLLLEYNNDMKLEIRLTMDKKKMNKYCTFNVLHYTHLSSNQIEKLKSEMYLCIPTVNPNINLEIIGNIWRLSNIT